MYTDQGKPRGNAMKNGWLANMNDITYHDGNGLSSSDIKYLMRSPAHWKAKEHKDTPALIFGRAFHCAVLEPDRFADTRIIIPQCDRRTKAGKKEYDEFQELVDDASILMNENDAVKIEGMAASIDAATDMLTHGIAELSGFYNSKSIGELLKIRPDYLKENVMYDVKTCEDARERAVMSSVRKYNYDLSAAYYLDVAEMIDGKRKYDRFIWIFVEKSPPYAVAIYEAHESLLENGRDKVEIGLNAYKDAKLNDKFSGYSTEIIQLLGD